MKAEKPQALKLGSEKVLVIAELKELPLTVPASNRNRYTRWYGPVKHSLENMYDEQCVLEDTCVLDSSQ